MSNLVVVHKFKDGQTIQPYPDSPEFARIIVAQHSSELVTGNNGQTWLKESTRIAFVKGKTVQLMAKFGKLKFGDVFSKDLCVQKLESFVPFYTWTTKDPATGADILNTQKPKIKPGNEKKGTVDEEVIVDGKPVYMQFVLAPVGAEDVLIQASAVAEEAAEDDLAGSEVTSEAPAIEEQEEDIAK